MILIILFIIVITIYYYKCKESYDNTDICLPTNDFSVDKKVQKGKFFYDIIVDDSDKYSSIITDNIEDKVKNLPNPIEIPKCDAENICKMNSSNNIDDTNYYNKSSF